MVPGKNYIYALTKVIGRNRDHSGNLVDDPNNSPILYTRFYEIIVRDGRVEEYSVNNILENLLEKFDGDAWETGLLYEIVSFCSDYNLAIHKGDDEFTRVNDIE